MLFVTMSSSYILFTSFVVFLLFLDCSTSLFGVENSPFHPLPPPKKQCQGQVPQNLLLTKNLLIGTEKFGGNPLQCISIPLFQAHLSQISRPLQNWVKSHLRHLRHQFSWDFVPMPSQNHQRWNDEGRPFLIPPKKKSLPRRKILHRFTRNQRLSCALLRRSRGYSITFNIQSLPECCSLKDQVKSKTEEQK